MRRDDLERVVLVELRPAPCARRCRSGSRLRRCCAAAGCCCRRRSRRPSRRRACDLCEVSPITQRSASTRFDLPQPFGPTTPVRPGSIRKSVGSTKDLKPISRRRVSFISFQFRLQPGVGEARQNFGVHDAWSWQHVGCRVGAENESAASATATRKARAVIPACIAPQAEKACAKSTKRPNCPNMHVRPPPTARRADCRFAPKAGNCRDGCATRAGRADSAQLFGSSGSMILARSSIDTPPTCFLPLMKQRRRRIDPELVGGALLLGSGWRRASSDPTGRR